MSATLKWLEQSANAICEFIFTLKAKRPEEFPAYPVDVVAACSLCIEFAGSELRLASISLHKISLAHVKCDNSEDPAEPRCVGAS